VMHAVSRDKSQFHSSCLYLQLDGEQSLRELTGSREPVATASEGEAMDTGGHVNGNGAVAGAEEAGKEEEAAADDEEADEPLEEVRLVPIDAKEEEGGLDAALEALFKALSDGAALNPDDDDDDDEGDGFFSAESFAEGEGGGNVLEITNGFGTEQMLSLEGATPEQLAMLERYDQMLEQSGSLQVNNDGRYDDPEEADAQP